MGGGGKEKRKKQKVEPYPLSQREGWEREGQEEGCDSHGPIMDGERGAREREKRKRKGLQLAHVGL